MIDLKPLNPALNGSSLPRGVYLSGGAYTAWVQGAAGAPVLPTHILWHIDYSDSVDLSGCVHYLDHTEMTAYGYSGGLFPAVPGVELDISVEYIPGEAEGPHSVNIETSSDAASEASASVTASNEKAVSFNTRKLEFTEVITDKSNKVRSLYRKAVLSETKGVFSGDPVFSLKPEIRRRAQRPLTAENGKVYYLASDGRISDDLRTAISRAAVGLPSGEWRTINRTIYVNYGLAAGNNDGTTPADAYRGSGCLAAAVADGAAKSVLLREPVFILLAGGTYPQEYLYGPTYRMRVFGGFSPDFSVRDFDLYETILDGEGTINGGISMTADAIVDGLTVKNLVSNSFDNAGLAVSLNRGLLRSCKIYDNSAGPDFRGGTAVAFGLGKAVNCYFSNNTGNSSLYWGVSSSGSMINCVVLGDTLSIYGIRNDANLINCTLIDDNSRPSDPWIAVHIMQTAPFNINLTNTVIYGDYSGKKNFVFPTSSPAPAVFPVNMSKVLLRGGVSGGNAYSSGTYYDIGEMVYTWNHITGEYLSYYCIQAGFNHTPASSPAYWRLIDESEVISRDNPGLDTDYTPLPGSLCIDSGDITAYTDPTSPAYGITEDYNGNPRYKIDGGGAPVSVDVGAVQKQD